MQLPPQLRSAFDQALEHVSRNLLSERAARISTQYRAGQSSSHAIRDELDALAYAVSRMPATFAAVRNVLARLTERCPFFSPATVLDFGAGPGTASWAAAEAWPSISSITQLDHNALLLGLGRKLFEAAPMSALRAVRQIHAGLAEGATTALTADLMLASYTLAEMSAPEIRAFLTSAWSVCTGALVIIEPGTPAGYERILLCRNLLHEQGAKVVAPCPHQHPCPLTAPDWCHFVQRVQRTRDHMLLKSADVPWEDEKFSYLIVAREHLFAPAGKDRILAPPEISKTGVAIKLCRIGGGAEFLQFTKRDTGRFKRMKKKNWGDEAD